jgi:predicted GH43/DUF377 family glycosyl hydrolase
MGDGQWMVYYGVADRSVAVAETTMDELLAVAKGELALTR